MRPPGWPEDPDAVVVAIGTGMYPEKQSLQVRVTPHLAQELANDIEAEGLRVGPVPMASAGPAELAAFAVATGGALTGLAAVLRAFLSRHQHKAVVFEQNGTRYEVRGMSPKDTAAMIDRVLGEALERQRGNDRLWDEVMPPLETPDADDGEAAQ